MDHMTWVTAKGDQNNTQIYIHFGQNKGWYCNIKEI